MGDSSHFGGKRKQAKNTSQSRDSVDANGQQSGKTASQLTVTEASQAIFKKQKAKLLKLPSKVFTAAFRRPSEASRHPQPSQSVAVRAAPLKAPPVAASSVPKPEPEYSTHMYRGNDRKPPHCTQEYLPTQAKALELPKHKPAMAADDLLPSQTGAYTAEEMMESPVSELLETRLQSLMAYLEASNEDGDPAWDATEPCLTPDTHDMCSAPESLLDSASDVAARVATAKATLESMIHSESVCSESAEGEPLYLAELQPAEISEISLSLISDDVLSLADDAMSQQEQLQEDRLDQLLGKGLCDTQACEPQTVFGNPLFQSGDFSVSEAEAPEAGLSLVKAADLPESDSDSEALVASLGSGIRFLRQDSAFEAPPKLHVPSHKLAEPAKSRGQLHSMRSASSLPEELPSPTAISDVSKQHPSKPSPRVARHSKPATMTRPTPGSSLGEGSGCELSDSTREKLERRRRSSKASQAPEAGKDRVAKAGKAIKAKLAGGLDISSPALDSLERSNRRLGREVARLQMRALAAEAKLAQAADVEAACNRISLENDRLLQRLLQMLNPDEEEEGEYLQPRRSKRAVAGRP